MSSSSAKYMGQIAALGCVVCRRILGHGYVPAEVHHCFDTATRSDWLTIGLCPEHHRGGTGFHGMGERAFNRLYSTTEAHLLGMTNEDLAKAKVAA